MAKRKTDAECDLINARLAIKAKRTMTSLRGTVDAVISDGVPAEDIIQEAMRTASLIGFREA